MEETDRVLDWDVKEADPDEGGHGGYVVLPEGYYPFNIEKFERARHPGSAKIPACPMAVLTLAVHGADGSDAIVRERLYLVERLLWKVASFMECIGMGRNPDGKVPIVWDGLEGRGGWLKLKTDTYTGRDGNQHESNKVDWFCKPDETEKAYKEYTAMCSQRTPAAAQTPMQQPAPAQKQTGWSIK